MNLKHFTLVLCVSIWSLTGYSQRDPDNEILVFFSDGITQKIETINGASVKTVSFTKAGLKQSLNAIGIPDSLMEFALPHFQREDTLLPCICPPLFKAADKDLQSLPISLAICDPN